MIGLSYSVSVALVDKGSTTLALVYDPQRDELWWAARCEGAHRLASASRVKETDYATFINSSETIMVSPAPLDDGNVLFDMPYDRTKTSRILGYVERLFENAGDVKRIGPASLDICRVAAGQAKLYLELDLKLWDYAAGELILVEAGGTSLHCDDLSLFGITSEVERAVQLLAC